MATAGGDWSTGSGKRLMMPRAMIGEQMVGPPAKKVRVTDNALVQPRTSGSIPEAPKTKGKQQNLAAFRCGDCDGTHFWGHGGGHDNGKGGKYYKCSKCRKTLPFLPQHEQDKRNDECSCVYCLAARLMKKGKSRAEAMAEAEGVLADAAEMDW